MLAAALRRIAPVMILAVLPWGAVSARAATIQIPIDAVAFQKLKVAAAVGDTIEWVNKDIFDHTATAKNGDFDVAIPAGRTVRFVVRKVGTIEYFCKLHPNMRATLVVTEPKK
jgi:plastocyanin